jgi:cell division protein FtsB
MDPVTQTDASGRTGSLRPVLGASVLLFLAVLGIAGVKSSHDLDAARQRKLMLETRIHSTETEIDRLRNRIERLRSDPGLLERHAREDLGMVRPGDVVIELPIEGNEPAPPAAIVPAPLPSPPAPLPRAGEGSTARASGDQAAPSAVPAAAPPPAPESFEHPEHP